MCKRKQMDYIWFLLYILLRFVNYVHLQNVNDIVFVNKCCEKFEILYDLACSFTNETETWSRTFTDELNMKVNFKFSIGRPACTSLQSWPIYHYPGSVDKLKLLPNGKLRHYFQNPENFDDVNFEESSKAIFYDFNQGQYCLEKAVTSSGPNNQSIYALVCSPDKTINWSDVDFIIRKILNPILTGISIIVLSFVAIVYFVLPTLRDLVGNIISTITFCIIIGQICSLVKIFTELSSHVSFVIADTVHYVSFLGAFFWLNIFGYYVWKTFRSRNVFLRIANGRKYCWYSLYTWGTISILSGLGLFSHYFLDSSTYNNRNLFENHESIGWLGIAIFFSPIACTIVINIFFFATTMKLINKSNLYGRIQHKLHNNFVIFFLLCLVMTTTWIFLILTWFNDEGFFYTHIVINALQPCFIFYICILRQKHVTFLLKKACCYNDPTSPGDWGDEMCYMNGGPY